MYMANTPKTSKPAIKPDYKDTSFKSDSLETERTRENIRTVSATPNWTPRGLYEQFAIYNSEAFLYDFENNNWINIAGSSGKRLIIKVFDDAATVATGNGKFIFMLPDDFAGLDLTDCEAFVTTQSSSGAITVQIRNVTQAADILSTALTIDASEDSSRTAATAAVINTSEDDYTAGDLIAIDVDGAGTGAKGLGVILIYG